MFMGGFFRFIAFLLLLGLLAVVGINIYNAGVTAGIGADIGGLSSLGARALGRFRACSAGARPRSTSSLCTRPRLASGRAVAAAFLY